MKNSRSDWMQGLLDAEVMYREKGVEYTLEYGNVYKYESVWCGYGVGNMDNCVTKPDYWEGFMDYLSNLSLRNKEDKI